MYLRLDLVSPIVPKASRHAINNFTFRPTLPKEQMMNLIQIASCRRC